MPQPRSRSRAPSSSANPPLASREMIRAVQLRDAEGLRRFLDQGASPDSQDQQDRSLLSIACEMPFNPCALALIQAGANPRGVSMDKRTQRQPLRLACQSGSADAVRALIQAGAPISLFGSLGHNLLVISFENPDCVAALIEAGIDLNHPNFEGTTPLMSAMIARPADFSAARLRSVALILAAGADPHRLNENGHSALDLCELYQNEPARALLCAELERQALLISTPEAGASTHKPRL